MHHTSGSMYCPGVVSWISVRIVDVVTLVLVDLINKDVL
jgi:hypothetical protein